MLDHPNASGVNKPGASVFSLELSAEYTWQQVQARLLKRASSRWMYSRWRSCLKRWVASKQPCQYWYSNIYRYLYIVDLYNVIYIYIHRTIYNYYLGLRHLLQQKRTQALSSRVLGLSSEARALVKPGHAAMLLSSNGGPPWTMCIALKGLRDWDSWEGDWEQLGGGIAVVNPLA